MSYAAVVIAVESLELWNLTRPPVPPRILSLRNFMSNIRRSKYLLHGVVIAVRRL